MNVIWRRKRPNRFAEICDEFEQRFGRKYDAVESYRMDDADYVFL